ncbi:MAG: hypothetical protein HY247_07365 [archaeon]|nr:MAG: hypothetical protein HY247_07365 [archaeon]
MDKKLQWFVELLATIVLWRIIDPLLSYLWSVVTSVPFGGFGLIPTLDWLSAISLAASILTTLASIASFSRWQDRRKANRTPTDVTQAFVRTLSPDLEVSNENMARMKALRQQFPMVHMDILNYPQEFLSRSQYHEWDNLMKQRIRIEALSHGRDARVEREVTKEVRHLVDPIMKSRRKYRLSIGERLSDSLGSSR